MHGARKKYGLVIANLLTIILILLALLLTVEKDSIRTFLTGSKIEIPTTTETASPYLENEEVVVIEATSTDTARVVLPITNTLFEYVAIKDSCGVHFEGDCVVVRSGPGTEFPVVTHLRNGVVLKVNGKVEHGDRVWYKIVFDEVLHYPERVTGDWYVAADYVDILYDEGDKTVWNDGSASTTKRIVVSIPEQKLYAYEGDKLFMETAISTGLELSPTPQGTFTVFKKTPSRFMQGPLPGLTDVYDLPGVPWNLYFTHEGAVIHGAYWHNSFGSRYSHGCVNLPPDIARKLYDWAVLGMTVTVE